MALLITWSDRYDVGNEQLNQQHQKLIQLINVLYAARKSHREAEFLLKVVKELHEYARYHFEQEEALLTACLYPKLAEHRAEHDEFRQWLGRIERAMTLEKSEKVITEDVMNYLKSWLNSHILISDKKFASAIQGQAA
jgi:hemerythrin-like metal-binding protein